MMGYKQSRFNETKNKQKDPCTKGKCIYICSDSIRISVDSDERGDENTEQQRQPRLTMMTWGLVPHFTVVPATTAGPDHYLMFNARVESLHEKRSYRDALPSRRGVVLLQVLGQ